MRMHSASEIHDEAMALAEEALLAGLKGDEETARAFAERALEKEKKAIKCLDPSYSQPSYSVMCRSAACLAIDAKMPREALIFAVLGIRDDALEEILLELQEVKRKAEKLLDKGVDEKTKV